MNLSCYPTEHRSTEDILLAARRHKSRKDLRRAFFAFLAPLCGNFICYGCG